MRKLVIRCITPARPGTITPRHHAAHAQARQAPHSKPGHNFDITSNMALGHALIKILEKKYEPSSFVEQRYKGYDLGFKTDEEGNPILLFIGKKVPDGNIKGQRYARRLLKDKDGKIAKDHWDDKGTVG